MYRTAFIQTRKASSSAQHAFPFPTDPRPTPHEIFHLPIGASPQDIKARYYDLVKIHHPDSPFCRDLPSSVRHARFQAITNAYAALRNRHVDPIRAELDRRRRTQEARARARRHAEFAGASFANGPSRTDWNASADDRWKDRLIITVGVLSLGVGLAPMFWSGLSIADQRHLAAANNLAQARREAREFGHERRKEIRKRVQEFREQDERKQNNLDASSDSCRHDEKS